MFVNNSSIVCPQISSILFVNMSCDVKILVVRHNHLEMKASLMSCRKLRVKARNRKFVTPVSVQFCMN